MYDYIRRAFNSVQKNILLTIAYDGSCFSGWQRQPDKPTVQGHLEQTMSRLFKKNITLNGSSRTDAGVHALGARASFKTDIGIPTDRIPMVVNNALCGREKGSFAIAPVRILEAKEMPEDFHARFSCKGKKYVYRIANTDTIDIFRRNYVYHVDRPLDVRKMQQAAAELVGTHDFKSFESSGGNPRETTVRTIFDAKVIIPDAHGRKTELTETGQSEQQANSATARGFAGDIEISVSGDGFLYNMVRIITGTLVDIGLGRIDTDDMHRIIEAKDRTQAGHTAPPYGLYLAEVYY